MVGENLKLQISGSYLLHLAADACFDWLGISLEEFLLCISHTAAQRQPLDLDADRKHDSL